MNRDESPCPKCGVIFGIGDWPFCEGGHAPLRERNAQRFDPIVVWASDSDPDKFSFPGQADEPVPEGYHRMELMNLREADRFVSRMNALERAKLISERDQRYALDDLGIRERRANEDARGTSSARAEALRRSVRQYVDRLRERRRLLASRLDPEFHINILSYDSGNRNSYSGPETNWRERKK